MAMDMMDLYNMPAVAPPPGVVPNFINPHSKKGELLVTNVVLTTLMGIFVVMRLISRGFISRHVGTDDYCCILAALASVAHAVVIHEQTKFGYGLHSWDVRVTTAIEAIENRIYLANNFPYMACLLFGKLSILFLYLRLFSVSRNTKNVIIATMVFTTAYTLSILGVSLASFVKCGSIAGMATDFCKAMGSEISIVQSVINVVTDFLILLIPLGMTMKLVVSLRKKVAVSSVFGTGLIACAASIGRLVSSVKTLDTNDTMWLQATNDVFTVLEMNCVIIVSCLLTLPIFFRHCKAWASKVYSSMHSSHKKSTEKLPEHQQDVLDQPRAAPKPPKDPYPMVTLTNITLMSADRASKHSVEENERCDSVEQESRG